MNGRILHLALLGGAGVSPDMAAVAPQAICATADAAGHRIVIEPGEIRVEAYWRPGYSLPHKTNELRERSDALLLDACGAPPAEPPPASRKKVIEGDDQ